MSSNLVGSIRTSSFAEMPFIKVLYLSTNRIEKIESNSFYKLNLLTYLDLSANVLGVLENDSFTSLFNLNKLNLRSNSIQVISKSLFNDLFNLVELNRDENPIRLIQDEGFSRFSNAKTLSINWLESNFSITNSTFTGLVSIKDLIINEQLLISLTAILNIKANLKPTIQDSVLNVQYYGSINVIYYNKEYTDWDCFLVLYSIRFQIQINLKDSLTKDAFLSYCGQCNQAKLSNMVQSRITEFLRWL
jgi:hypothetical protein